MSDDQLSQSSQSRHANGQTSGQVHKKENEERNWLERIMSVLRINPKNRDDLVDALTQAQQNQVIDDDALSMIEGVLQVSEMQVREIMIPRTNMTVIDKEMSLEEVLPLVVDSAHSRYPVVGENRDEIVGILLAKDLLPYFLSGDNGKFSIREILRTPIFIPESKRLNILLKEFRANRNHIAIVVDEYGGVAGLVTIEDVLEQIVGEIEDEHDFEDDLYIMDHAQDHATVKALTPIEDFNEHFSAEFSDNEFDTIGGLVINSLGRLPKRGDTLDLNGFHFKVVRADNRRVYLLRVERIKVVDNDTEEGSADSA